MRWCCSAVGALCPLSAMGPAAPADGGGRFVPQAGAVTSCGCVSPTRGGGTW